MTGGSQLAITGTDLELTIHVTKEVSCVDEVIDSGPVENVAFVLHGACRRLSSARCECAEHGLHLAIFGSMDAIDRFQELVAPATTDQLRSLRIRVRTHLDLIDEASLTDRSLSVAVGKQLADTLISLIDGASSFDRHQQALVRGAAEYFILTQDSANDVRDPDGLHDDVAVVNYVCEQVDRADLMIRP